MEPKGFQEGHLKSDLRCLPHPLANLSFFVKVPGRSGGILFPSVLSDVCVINASKDFVNLFLRFQEDLGTQWGQLVVQGDFSLRVRSILDKGRRRGADPL